MDLEKILKISKDMCVQIEANNSGKHYIKDKSGKRIEFDTVMITSDVRNSFELPNDDILE